MEAPSVPEPVKSVASAPKNAATGLGGRLKKIPVWGWVIVIGGGFIIAIMITRARAQGADDGAAAQDANGDPVQDTGGDGTPYDGFSVDNGAGGDPSAGAFGIPVGEAGAQYARDVALPNPTPSTVTVDSHAVTHQAFFTGGGAPVRPPVSHRGPKTKKKSSKPKHPPKGQTSKTGHWVGTGHGHWKWVKYKKRKRGH